jgi:hypothetical protein
MHKGSQTTLGILAALILAPPAFADTRQEAPPASRQTDRQRGKNHRNRRSNTGMRAMVLVLRCPDHGKVFPFCSRHGRATMGHPSSQSAAPKSQSEIPGGPLTIRGRIFPSWYSRVFSGRRLRMRRSASAQHQCHLARWGTIASACLLFPLVSITVMRQAGKKYRRF